MKHTRFISFSAAALSLCGLAGCGGGDGGTASSTDSTNAAPLTRAQTQLNSLAAGTQDASGTALQSALTLFQQAIQQSPDDATAHFGAAITLAGLLSQHDDPAGSTDGLPPDPPITGIGGGAYDPPPSPPSRAAHRDVTTTGTAGSGSVLQIGGSVPPVPPGVTTSQPLPSARALGLIWNLSPAVSNPNLLLHVLGPVADFRAGYLPYFANNGIRVGVDDPASRQKLLADLGTVVADLAKVEADPKFTYALPGQDGAQSPRTLGLPEVYLFDAYVQSLRVKVALSLAYRGGVDPADAPPTAPGTGAGASHTIRKPSDLDTNHDGKLPPTEYLAASPFLTLRNADYLTTAQAALVAVADRESKGVAGVLARKDGDTSFLVSNTSAVRGELATVRDKTLPVLRQAAIGPVTIQEPYFAGTPINLPASDTPPTVPPTLKFENVTVNLAAWFANPPADLKAFAPTYFLDSSGYIVPSKTTYPDATFGGLFPNRPAEDGAVLAETKPATTKNNKAQTFRPRP